MMMTIIFTIATILLSFLVRYLLGFGSALIMVPLLSIIMDFREAVIISIILELIICVIIYIENMGETAFSALTVRMIAGALFGAIMGLGLAQILPGDFIVIFSLLSAFIFSISLLRPAANILQGTKVHYGVGVISGCLNVWSGFSGPPVVWYIYSIGKDMKEIRIALNTYFLLVYLATLGLFIVTNQFASFSNWDTFIYAVPTLFAGLFLVRYFPARKPVAFYRYLSVFLIQTSIIMAVANIIYRSGV